MTGRFGSMSVLVLACFALAGCSRQDAPNPAPTTTVAPPVPVGRADPPAPPAGPNPGSAEDKPAPAPQKPEPAAASGPGDEESRVAPKKVTPLVIPAPTLGSSVIRVPATMKQGREAIAQLVVSPTDLASLLSQSAVAAGGADVRDRKDRVRLVPRMRASLVAPGFDYAPKDAQEQAIKTDEPTVWTWALTPSESGSRTLVFTLEGLVTVDGHETAIRPPALTVPVEVAVDPMLIVGRYWQWGTTAIVIPLAVFFFRRRADRRKTPPGG